MRCKRWQVLNKSPPGAGSSPAYDFGNRTLGQRYVGVSYMDGQQTADGYRRMAEEMNQWGETARTYGLRWYAHLHDNEFATDETTGSSARAPTRRPTSTGTRTGSRCSTSRTAPPPTEGIETDLGEGTVDFPAILSHLHNLGSHDFVIERDQQPHPVRTAHVSYDYLRSIRVPRAC